MACVPMAKSLDEEASRMKRTLKWSGYKHVSIKYFFFYISIYYILHSKYYSFNKRSKLNGR